MYGPHCHICFSFVCLICVSFVIIIKHIYFLTAFMKIGCELSFSKGLAN